MNLRNHILEVLPTCTVTLSQPFIRTDDHRANAIIRIIIVKLNKLKLPVLGNSNIVEKHLGKKGHHLSEWGKCKFAINLINLIRGL